jgi:hypothetical protein
MNRWISLFLVAATACLTVECAAEGQNKPPSEPGSEPRLEGGSSALRPLYPLGGKPVMPLAPTGPGANCPASGPANACSIKVDVNPAKCNAADDVRLPEYILLPQVAIKSRIIWTLSPGYVFCARAGDGVFVKDPNVDEVYKPVDNAGCSSTFEWKRVTATGTDLQYYLRFRSASNICVKDPWMRN